MATANAKFTIANYPDGIDNTERSIIVRGTVAVDPSAATYATGGIPVVNALNVTLSAWANELIKATGASAGNPPLPRIVDFWDQTGGTTSYVYTWVKSTNKFQIFTSNGAAPAAFAEFTNAAAIPAAVSSGVIYFEAQFARTTG